MNTHTKGPWKIENHTHEIGPFTSAEFEIWSNNRHICTVNEHVDDLKIDQANANLIATAPEMLEALEDCRTLLRSGDLDKAGYVETVLGEIESVLKKAKGQGS